MDDLVKKKRGWPKTLLTILLVLLIIAGASGTYYFYSKFQQARQENEKLGVELEGQKNQNSEAQDEIKKWKDRYILLEKKGQKTDSQCPSTLTDADRLLIKGWKKINNSKYSFSFQYPMTWEVEKDQSDHILLRTDEASIILDYYIGSPIELSHGEPQGYEITSQSKVTVACQEADRIEYSKNNKRLYVVDFQKSGSRHLITFSFKDVGASMTSDVVEAFDIILKTITFE